MGYFVEQVNINTAITRGVHEEAGAVSFLYDREGNRKYLMRAERDAFLAAAQRMPSAVRTFCLTLAYTGARVSEVLALTPQRIDPTAGIVVVESLKKRRRGRYRAVPIPMDLIHELDRVHGIKAARDQPERARQRVWPWSRTTGWNRTKACMALAGIHGPPASPKGLRHAFGVVALQAGVPINLVRKWLGHSRLSTTEIYADAIGPEEQDIAARFWRTFQRLPPSPEFPAPRAERTGNINEGSPGASRCPSTAKAAKFL